MKKIGILTHHRVCNFGAQLQATSTVGFLKRKGYEPIVINWYPKDLDDMYQKRVSKEQYAYHIHFTEENMPLTGLCQTEDELVEVLNENNLDAIILGSDALFRFLPKSERKMFSKQKLRIVEKPFASDQVLEGNPFWGSFIPKLETEIPVAVFSVSSQNSQYTKVNKQEFSLLETSLRRFKYITVRDEWTKELVQYFIGNTEVPVTPDPVFSFNQNTYLPILSKQEIIEKYNLPNKYILLSFRNKNISDDFVKEIGATLIMNGYNPVAFPHPEGLKDYGFAHKIPMPLMPMDWYYLIKYSDGYIGERMHPIIVSLHNAVPFFCFDEYGTIEKRIPYTNKFGKYLRESSKIYHILSKIGLLDNIISIKKDMKKITSQEVVEKLLSIDKQQLMDFSKRQQESYEKGMNKLLENLNLQ
ncbi:MAG: polysaccharide pyruvyl transferase family protein [Prevotella sp.]|jgi:hypothetical protein|nr:polysaccharide pyruvyl transferase family protein [Prevotella sp.]